MNEEQKRTSRGYTILDLFQLKNSTFLSGYGPPSPVEFNSNEVASHEYSPVDFGNYGSFSSGSSSGYTAPNTNYAKSGPSYIPQLSSGRSGLPSYKSSGAGKGGVSSSYISIVHGPGGAASPSKQRPIAYSAPSKSQPSAAAYKSQNFPPSAAFNEGPSGFTSAEISTYFGKGFGAAPSSQYNEGGYDFPSRSSGHKQHQQHHQAQQGGEYESNASDEVGSYSSGGPSYATFSGSKPSFNPSTFSSHSGSRGNAYSTSNIHFNSGKANGGHGGHGNFHPPSFVGSFKPSNTKPYNRYTSPNAGYQVAGSNPTSFGVAPLVGSETNYNSRALKAGYTAEHGNKNVDEINGEDAANFFAGFGDGAGFKVQSSYSSKDVILLP